MDKSVKKKPLLRIKFEGTAIRNNTILFDDLSTFISNISLAVDRTVQKLIQQDVAIKRGRPSKAMQILSALEIVSVRKGSFTVALDLRRDGTQFPGWDVGEQAVDELFKGMKAIAKDTQTHDLLDQSILIPLRDAGRIIDRGIENIYINSNSSFGKKRIKYEQSVREKIITRISKYEHAYTAVEGRLLMADVEEDKLRCRLRPSTGDPISCSYDEEMTEQVMRHLRNFVQVRGDARYDLDSGKLTSFHIKDIEPIEQLSDIGVPEAPLSSFWKGKSFEELALDQAVYPIVDLGKLYSEWPEDTDFDAFFNAVRSARN